MSSRRLRYVIATTTIYYATFDTFSSYTVLYVRFTKCIKIAQIVDWLDTIIHIILV